MLTMPTSSSLARCPLFGTCGGCQYQDIPYAQELQLKEQSLRDGFAQSGLHDDGLIWSKIVASPKEYNYRSRLDMKFLKTRNGEVFMGFSPAARYRVVPVESCSLAMEPVSDFLPELKRQAAAKLPGHYRNANLVVKTGDDGRVFWGGIGRRSLRMKPEDYLWTEATGRRIFYSLDTFFQANLSILGALIQVIENLGVLNKATTLYDFYGGVGLFAVSLYDKVKEVALVEENPFSAELARFNAAHHGLDRLCVLNGCLEDEGPRLAEGMAHQRPVIIIDPPRKGLSPTAASWVSSLTRPRHCLYLSCDAQSLIRDLGIFQKNDWRIERVIPFDFFPKTRHTETLAVLSRKGSL